MKVFITNRQSQTRISQQRIRKHLIKCLRLLGLHGAEVSVLLVSGRRMRILNRKYRGIDRTTDVLSFPQLDCASIKGYIKMQYQTSKTGKQAYKISRIPLGDIVIDIQKARAQALDYGSSLHDELKRLLIHGLLHLAGYDHEKSRYAAQKMRAKEHALLKDLNTF